MRTLILTLTVFAVGRASADERQDHLSTAQHAFNLGVSSATRPVQARRHFAEALQHYRALHDLGVRDAALYRNLGNAAALADRWPEALWAYHVGLKLDPNDAQLRAHRDQLRAKVVLPPYGQGRNEPEFWPAWLHRPTLQQALLAAGALHAVFWLLLAFTYVRGSRLLAVATMFTGLLTAGACVGVGYEHRQMQIDQDTPLVIVADNTPLYRGNGPNYPAHPDIAVLPRGLEARQIHRRGSWLQIRLTSGEVGWIPSERAHIVLTTPVVQ